MGHRMFQLRCLAAQHLLAMLVSQPWQMCSRHKMSIVGEQAPFYAAAGLLCYYFI